MSFLPGFSSKSSAPPAGGAALRLAVYSLVLVLVTVVVTLAVGSVLEGPSESGESAQPVADEGTPITDEPRIFNVGFGTQDVVIAKEQVPGGQRGGSLLYFDARVDRVPSPFAKAVFVSFRVECTSGGEPVAMQASGKTGTNMFLARGGQVSGQALTPESDEELECSLLAAAPFIEVPESGPDALPMQADMNLVEPEAENVLAGHRLDDATVLEPGEAKSVLSVRLDEATRISSMHTALRLTSCTVVGGSRDGTGKNKCTEAMTGHESATVQVMVEARWLDEQDEIASRTTLWKETLGIDYSTHHEPWQLRQENLSERISSNREDVVLAVIVKSVEGTPVVVHADGSDAVVSLD